MAASTSTATSTATPEKLPRASEYGDTSKLEQISNEKTLEAAERILKTREDHAGSTHE